MKNRLNKYDIELFNNICDIKESPNIISTYKNRLDEMWCRNYKNKILFNSSIIIDGLKPNCKGSEFYLTNLNFGITPEQAESMILELKRVLRLRKEEV